MSTDVLIAICVVFGLVDVGMPSQRCVAEKIEVMMNQYEIIENRLLAFLFGLAAVCKVGFVALYLGVMVAGVAMILFVLFGGAAWLIATMLYLLLSA